MKSINNLKGNTVIKIVGNPMHGHMFYDGQHVIVGDAYDTDNLTTDEGRRIAYGRNCRPMIDDKRVNDYNGSSSCWYVYDGEFEEIPKKIKLSKLKT